MKKTLAILLSLALIICMIPGSAFAATTPLTASIDKNSDLYTGSALSLPTVAVKNSGIPVTDTSLYTVTWTDASGNTISEGTVTDAGKYTAAITAGDGYTVTPASFTYTVEAIDLSNAAVSYSGDTEKTEAFNNAENGAEVILTGTIKVTQNGKEIDSKFYSTKVTKEDADRIKITATANTENNGNNVVSSVKFIYVTLTTDISLEYKIWGTGTGGAIPDQTYNNGKALTPTVYVIPKTASSTSASGKLTQGTDYKVTYSGNTSGGTTATVTVTGIGKYSGTLSESFTILGKSISSVSASGNNTKQYNEPVLTVKDGSNELEKDKDYLLTGWDSTAVGSSAGKATIQGINNYTGTKTVTYTVVSESNYIDSSDISCTSTQPYYNGSVQSANVTVTITNSSGTISTLRAGTDYTLSYKYTDSNGNTVTTTSPKDSGTYSVYVTGKGSYATDGEIYAGTLTIQPVLLDYAEIVLGSSTVLQDGVYVPKVSVKHIVDNFYFAETDYTVEYRYVNSSSIYLKPVAVVTPTENGNLTALGSVKKTLEAEFSTASRSLSNCTANFTDYRTSKAYDGVSSFQPAITVKDSSLNRTLVKGTDYTVTYKNAAGETVTYLKDAGTYTITITGIGSYSGTKTLTYTITGTDISQYTVTLKNSSVQADGYGRVPVIESVKSGSLSSLTASDYTVSYEDASGNKVTSMVTPGTYKVVVTGKNGYMGSTYATFRIIGTPQTLTVDKTSHVVYEGSDSFKIAAAATGDGTGFSYTTNDASVATVSSTGVVTIHKVGRAVITVTTTGNTISEPASKVVYVKVHPDKGYITQKPWNSGKKAQMQVRWQYQQGVTKYQIKYSTTSTFKTYKTKTVAAHGKDYATQSTTIKNLTSGKQYYFKVRAVYETYNEKGDKIVYYGKWSNWRSAKVK